MEFNKGKCQILPLGRDSPDGQCRHRNEWLESSGSTSVPGSSNVAAGSNRRLQQTQHQVDEVVDIMRVNVDKVLERDQKLSELDDRADALQAGASQFETSAAKLKRKYWWKNCKMWAILIAVVVIIVILIIGKFHQKGAFLLSWHKWC
ncbi:PREDICTED: vesicle-associated membrane protein 3 [Chaetura pelagica]|uniref:vesicle-associated membrane protein 3 n=1 Tax=Chaetura pelagica TaxID=8897 RepID=UPI000523E6ED|nr:PREDICTED: vesicle-associated membrane protein 3 [Chaetura pelagica]